MLIFDHPRQPYGGHLFVDPSSHVLKAKTIRELIDAVAAYRKANGMPAGDPESEIEISYRTRFPWLVSKAGKQPKVPEPDRVHSWIMEQWSLPEKEPHSGEEATRRLEICKVCPHWLETAPISEDDRKRLVVLSGFTYRSDGGLCTKFEFPCGYAVFLDPDVTPPDDCSCWVKA